MPRKAKTPVKAAPPARGRRKAPPKPVASPEALQERLARRTAFAGEPDKEFRFTEDRRKRLLLLLRSTMPLRRACERIGCDDKTPSRWRAAGHAAIAAQERGEVLDALAVEQAAFAVQYDEALTESETHMIAMVQRGAAKDWRAAAWRLSCLRPEDYSERFQARKLEIEADAPLRAADLAAKQAAAVLIGEKIEAIREVRRSGGQVLVVGAEDLVAALVAAEELPADLRSRVSEWIAERGFRLLEARDLGAEPEEGGS